MSWSGLMTRECAVLTTVTSLCFTAAVVALRWSAGSSGASAEDDDASRLPPVVPPRRKTSTPGASPAMGPHGAVGTPPPMMASSSPIPAAAAKRPSRQPSPPSTEPVPTRHADGSTTDRGLFPAEPVPGGAWALHRRTSSGVPSGVPPSPTAEASSSVVVSRSGLDMTSSSVEAITAHNNSGSGSSTPTSSPSAASAPRPPSALAKPSRAPGVRRVHIALDPVTSSHASPVVQNVEIHHHHQRSHSGDVMMGSLPSSLTLSPSVLEGEAAVPVAPSTADAVALGPSTPAPPAVAAVVDELLQLGVAHRHRPHVHHKRTLSDSAVAAPVASADDPTETPSATDLQDAVRHALSLSHTEQQHPLLPPPESNGSTAATTDPIGLLRDRIRAGADCRVLATALLRHRSGVITPAALRGGWMEQGACHHEERPLLYDVVEFAPATSAASLLGLVIEASRYADEAEMKDDLVSFRVGAADPLLYHACLDGSDAGAEATVAAVVAIRSCGIAALVDAGDMDWSPLQLAAATGKRAAVQRMVTALQESSSTTLRALLTPEELMQLELTTDEADPEKRRVDCMVSLLVDRATAGDMMTPLMHALACDSFATCEVLLSAGAEDPEFNENPHVDANGRTSVHHVVLSLHRGVTQSTGPTQILTRLLRARCDGDASVLLDVADRTGETALHLLLAPRLAPLASSPSTLSPSRSEWPCIPVPLDEEHIKRVKQVLTIFNQYGATTAVATSDHKVSPLHYAAMLGDGPLLRALLDGWLETALRERRASPTLTTMSHRRTSSNGDEETRTHHCASSPPPPSRQGSQTYTRSHHRGPASDESAALLGSVINVPDADGRTPLFLACSQRHGYPCVVALVDEYHALVDVTQAVPSQSGHTLFSAAIRAGAGRTAHFLLQRCNVNVFDVVRVAPYCVLLDALSYVVRKYTTQTDEATQNEDAAMRLVIDAMMPPPPPPTDDSVASHRSGSGMSSRQNSSAMVPTALTALRWCNLTASRERDHYTALHAACATGNDRTIRNLIAVAVAVAPSNDALLAYLLGTLTECDRTPLQIAARELAADGCEGLLNAIVAASQGATSAAEEAVAQRTATDGSCAMHLAVDRLLRSPPLSPSKDLSEASESQAKAVVEAILLAVRRTVATLERYNLTAANTVRNDAGRTALDLAPSLW